MIRFIGDVHGKYDRYKKIISDCNVSIQVGDMGVGFKHPYTDEYMANPPHYAMIKGNHRFIRGNHDSPSVCRKHSQYIADGHVEDNMMFIGGGLSIDRIYRVEGYTWWADEELTIDQFYKLMDVYEATKPRIMVTHDCPESVVPLILNYYKKEYPSITRQALDSMLYIHRPEIWVFGHWHQSVDTVIDGTRFICLNELEYKDIEV